MNAIVLTIVVTGVILLVYALLMRRGRDINSEVPQEEVHPRLEQENHQLMHQPEWNSQPKENVTPSLITADDRSHCPACGESITANDVRCPSCDIAFVADGSQKWTLKAVGPADGIFLPPTEVSE